MVVCKYVERRRRACDSLPLFDTDTELVESVCHDAANANNVPYRSVAAHRQIALYIADASVLVVIRLRNEVQ